MFLRFKNEDIDAIEHIRRKLRFQELKPEEFSELEKDDGRKHRTTIFLFQAPDKCRNFLEAYEGRVGFPSIKIEDHGYEKDDDRYFLILRWDNALSWKRIRSFLQELGTFGENVTLRRNKFTPRTSKQGSRQSSFFENMDDLNDIMFECLGNNSQENDGIKVLETDMIEDKLEEDQDQRSVIMNENILLPPSSVKNSSQSTLRNEETISLWLEELDKGRTIEDIQKLAMRQGRLIFFLQQMTYLTNYSHQQYQRRYLNEVFLPECKQRLSQNSQLTIQELLQENSKDDMKFNFLLKHMMTVRLKSS